MATGDDALAAGMDILDGTEPANTLDTEVNKTRDYIAQRTSAVTPIAKGGTGAETAAQARQNLGVQSAVTAIAGATEATVANSIMRRGTGGRVNVGAPQNPENATTKTYVDDGLANRMPRTGGTFTGNVAFEGYGRFPNATPATSGYTVAYLDSTGILSRGASSERYKQNLRDLDPAELGDIWPQLTGYQMIDGDGSERVGYIAERLDESDDLRRFVVYAEFDGEHVPESIDFIALLMAQNAQLHQAVQLLADRLDALEAPNAED